MIAHDSEHGAQPVATTVLVVRDDETGWSHVAHDIDPRRRPRFAGFIQIDTERALVAGLAAADFRLAAAYRIDEYSTAFLFGRVAARDGGPPALVVDRRTTGAAMSRA
ncbi:hypothetical protein SAMN04489727_1929 [Amycolatopsis tolypomycina]|uniref:Uncharacterized protein n=1 Tax=Amycolatopsis tolypomycina TaxID=208445 RepID=A0A1H4JK72_9PSEU|nr:hypothetical protein [Amycolatopsis tolypomycina]SEB46032.1 hypothetical protein SAMN04489727_1929 [Amycolatopsis tolypomycina]